MNWFCCGLCYRNTIENIRFLDYSHASLQEVPSEVYLYERTLEKLYLDSNRILELPKQLFNCDELRILNLSDNEINFLPPAVSLLINLHHLDLSKNGITKIPENVRNCTCLSILDLSINPLEKFPESLINLISLKELYLTDIYLEFLPANFGKLVNLKILELRENNLSTLPRTMSRLIHLTRLDIGNNEFSELPEVVSSLHNITELWIDGNRIRKIYPSIGQLRKIIHFEASNNKIDLLPFGIGYWTKIVEFSISNNDISQLPTTIGNMKNLTSLKLDENELRTLPDTLGKLVNVEELMINHNKISQLPTSIGLLRKLQVLIADKNKLTSIPSELGSCASLAILSLRDNRIIDIPAEIGQLSSLRVLNLVGNQLRYLPMSLLKLDKLSALWLSNNQSQPLVPLQQEINNENYQMVLTCFMLPQLSHSRTDYPREPTGSLSNHRHICFATDAFFAADHPKRFLRAPTPYPKELRALAKHAKSVQRGLNVSNQKLEKNDTIPDTLQIREAKVSITANNINVNTPSQKPSNITDSYPIEDTCSLSSSISSSLQQTIEMQTNTLTNLELYGPKDYPADDNELTLPILTVKYSPVIRKAKNIRTDAQNQSALEISPKDVSVSYKNDYKNLEYKQPPPYYIAATQSLQSQKLYSDYAENGNTSYSPQINVIMDKKTASDNYSDSGNYSERTQNVYSNNTSDNKKESYEMTCTADMQNSNYEKKTSKSTPESYSYDPKQEYDKNKFCNNIQSQNEYKPRTFIQDKPSPNEYIIAPTPKRPVGPENGIVMPFFKEPNTIDVWKSNLSSINHNSGNFTQEKSIDNSPNTSGVQKNYNESDRKTLNTSNHDNTPNSNNTPSSNNTSNTSNSNIKWAFGQHKNVTVEQVTLQRISDLGFTIREKQGYGIFIDSVIPDGPAYNVLKVGDKILEVDGIDFTEINEVHAINILLSSSSFINMMISHMD